jgi:RES domain-containing protein
MQGQTVRVYRLIPTMQSRDALDGAGSALTGGRWNRRGKPAVYVATTVSLALLEIVRHRPEQLRSSLSLVTLDIPPTEIDELPEGTLPGRWWTRERACQSIGDAWLSAAGALALRVPSVIHAHEDNLVLNPAHARYRGLTATAVITGFVLDERLRGIAAQ